MALRPGYACGRQGRRALTERLVHASPAWVRVWAVIHPGTRWTYRRTFPTLRQPSGHLPNHLPWFPTFRAVVRCPFRCPFRCPTFRSVVPFRSALSHCRDLLARAVGADTPSSTCVGVLCIILNLIRFNPIKSTRVRFRKLRTPPSADATAPGLSPSPVSMIHRLGCVIYSPGT